MTLKLNPFSVLHHALYLCFAPSFLTSPSHQLSHSIPPDPYFFAVPGSAMFVIAVSLTDMAPTAPRAACCLVAHHTLISFKCDPFQTLLQLYLGWGIDMTWHNPCCPRKGPHSFSPCRNKKPDGRSHPCPC